MLQISCYQSSTAVFCDLIEFSIGFIRKRHVHRRRHNGTSVLPEPIQKRIDLSGAKPKFWPLKNLPVFQHDSIIITWNYMSAEDQSYDSGRRPVF